MTSAANAAALMPCRRFMSRSCEYAGIESPAASDRRSMLVRVSLARRMAKTVSRPSRGSMSSKMSTGTILVSVLAFSRCCSAADATIDFAALFGFTGGSGTDPAERTFDFASIGISPHLRQVTFKRVNRREDDRTHHMLNFRILAGFDFVIGPALFGFLAIGLPLRRAARSCVPATTA